MASPNRPARLNRGLLLIVAVVLLLAAAFVLLTAFGVLSSLVPGLPSADAPLTPATLSLPTWASYVAVAVAVVVGLLALRWLLAQTQRRPATGNWRLEQDAARGSTVLDAGSATDPLVEEIQSFPGVHRASASLSGTASRPVLHLVLGTEDAADITALRRRIHDEAIPRLRQSLDLATLPADILFRLDDARSARLN